MDNEDVLWLERWNMNLQIHIKDKNYKAAWSDATEITRYLKRINKKENEYERGNRNM